jgi:hypothetical protein
MAGSFFRWGDGREKSLPVPTPDDHHKPLQLRVLRQNMPMNR